MRSKCCAVSTRRAGGRVSFSWKITSPICRSIDTLRGAGYRIVRRYENNGWYVPNDSAVRIQGGDWWEIFRKYYLALPFRWLRNFSRRLRGK